MDVGTPGILVEDGATHGPVMFPVAHGEDGVGLDIARALELLGNRVAEAGEPGMGFAPDAVHGESIEPTRHNDPVPTGDV